MTIALEHPVGTTAPVTLVSPEVADRLARRITTEHPEIDQPTARRVIGQAAAFVAASGRQPGQSLAPSKLVDYGWHAFILHTVDYAEFCQRVVGRFVHHVPTDEDEETPGWPAGHPGAHPRRHHRRRVHGRRGVVAGHGGLHPVPRRMHRQPQQRQVTAGNMQGSSRPDSTAGWLAL